MTKSESLQKVKTQLHDAGLKLTPQREATVLVLLESQNEPLSAEEIFFFVKQKNAEIGLATVYRTLDVLTNLAIVDKITLADGVARYDLHQSGQQRQHQQLICTMCGAVTEIDVPILADVSDVLATQYHFLVKEQRVIFQGLCQQCQK